MTTDQEILVDNGRFLCYYAAMSKRFTNPSEQAAAAAGQTTGLDCL